MQLKLDKTDKKILNLLQENGRLQNLELSKIIGLSPSPCLRRVRALEEQGVIQNYVAQIDAAKVGAGFTVFARIWLKGQDEETVSSFIQAIQQMHQIMECYLMAGDCDFLLRIITADLESYRKFQADHLARILSIQNIKTEIPMQKVKLTSKILL